MYEDKERTVPFRKHGFILQFDQPTDEGSTGELPGLPGNFINRRKPSFDAGGRHNEVYNLRKARMKKNLRAFTRNATIEPTIDTAPYKFGNLDGESLELQQQHTVKGLSLNY